LLFLSFRLIGFKTEGTTLLSLIVPPSGP